MTAFVITTCIAIAFLGIQIFTGLRRIERLKAPYRDRPKLIGAFERVGGPRRACTPAGIELAHRVVDRLSLNADFDRQILVGVGSNFYHPDAVYSTEEARAQAEAKLTAYAREEAERERSAFLDNVATFLCGMHSDRTLTRLAAQQPPKLQKDIAEACYWLLVWTTSGCVGASVGRLRDEGVMPPLGVTSVR